MWKWRTRKSLSLDLEEMDLIAESELMAESNERFKSSSSHGAVAGREMKDPDKRLKKSPLKLETNRPGPKVNALE